MQSPNVLIAAALPFSFWASSLDCLSSQWSLKHLSTLKGLIMRMVKAQADGSESHRKLRETMNQIAKNTRINNKEIKNLIQNYLTKKKENSLENWIEEVKMYDKI